LLARRKLPVFDVDHFVVGSFVSYDGTKFLGNGSIQIELPIRNHAGTVQADLGGYRHPG
jgi:hypothetical protein